MPQTADRSAFDLLSDECPNLMFQLRNEVSGLVANGMTIIEASELVGIDVPDRLPSDPPYTPTPAMIRQRCSDIQSGWTSTEWRSRNATSGGDPVEIHTVRVRDCGEA